MKPKNRARGGWRGREERPEGGPGQEKVEPFLKAHTMCLKVISPEEPRSSEALPAPVPGLATIITTQSENGQKRVRHQS